MNTKYEKGPVIRSAEAASFTEYAFPAQLPTEEWDGDEARNYDNYLRPIANLFENDRAQESFIKNLVKGTFTSDNSVVYGCTVANTNSYYEITEGIFVYNGVVYHIFPACEAAAKQIEAIAETLAINTDVKIWYDGTYYYSYTLNLGTTTSGSAGTAAGAISAILTGLNIPSTSLTVEKSIILPIFTSTGKFYFNGSINVGATVPSGALELNVAPTSKFYGSKITDNSLTNEMLENNYVVIGTTPIELGSSSADFANVASINGISQTIDASQNLHITSASAAITCPKDKNYTLGDACVKAVESNAAFTANEALPTVSAAKGYIENKINTQARASSIEFQNGVRVTGGKVSISDTTDADVVSNNAVSTNASLYTAGGIEAKGSICSEKNIIGLNSGTYSSRAYKENITPFTESAVDLINTIDIVNYTYKADEDHNHKIGFIADDTHEYFATKDHNIMDQSNCIGLLLKAVQELSAENKELRKELNELKHNS